ncbi:MAG TPA: N-acetylglutaminylglutamine amidotransferase [Solirubrobacteraceae bacterium]|jgi:asparagine synthase (glutamine-hydrolysing)|nr:N-acetylglutaminylglutamine amidotransferase [Solirubrobacteraceae bacterium]
MCGFAGEFTTGRAPDREAVERMAATMADRGPDGSGAWADGPVALAHRRLKVIDLSSTGDQPMVDYENGMTIVFNGCIYNHRELRARLEREGYNFFSTSDTEVILKAHDHWGHRCAELFAGMFAYVLYEHYSGRLFLVRDRLGIKPLYLADVGDSLRFASTLPALLAGGGVDTELDPVALHHYFTWHAGVPAPRTMLAGVQKLAPATVMIVSPDGQRHSENYWRAHYTRHPRFADWAREDWSEAILDALRTAVERRMVSDVPVGVLLSGGLDSSLIVALLAEGGQRGLATFSVGFDGVGDDEGDEFAFSDLIAKQFETDHHQIHVPEEGLLESLDGAIGAMSEPMVSHDAVAFYLLAQEVAHSHKVVQSGQGADEVFAGYFWYPPLLDAAGSGEEDYVAAFFDRPHTDMAKILQPRYQLEEDASRAFLDWHFRQPGAETPIDRALRFDTEVLLPEHPVMRLDNMSMAWGLESRTPFLDHELVELAAACPSELKLADGGKGVLKAASRGVVSDAVIDRPKAYFPVPAFYNLEGATLDLIRDTLDESAIEERGLFRLEYIQQLVATPSEHMTTLGGSTLWHIALLELWLHRHGL